MQIFQPWDHCISMNLFLRKVTKLTRLANQGLDYLTQELSSH